MRPYSFSEFNDFQSWDFRSCHISKPSFRAIGQRVELRLVAATPTIFAISQCVAGCQLLGLRRQKSPRSPPPRKIVASSRSSRGKHDIPEVHSLWDVPSCWAPSLRHTPTTPCLVCPKLQGISLTPLNPPFCFFSPGFWGA